MSRERLQPSSKNRAAPSDFFLVFCVYIPYRSLKMCDACSVEFSFLCLKLLRVDNEAAIFYMAQCSQDAIHHGCSVCLTRTFLPQTQIPPWAMACLPPSPGLTPIPQINKVTLSTCCGECLQMWEACGPKMQIFSFPLQQTPTPRCWSEEDWTEKCGLSQCLNPLSCPPQSYPLPPSGRTKAARIWSGMPRWAYLQMLSTFCLTFTVYILFI